MAQPQPLPQPDFGVICDAMADIGRSFSGMCNAIGQQFSEIAASLAAINQNIERLNNRMDKLETQEANTAARLWNGRPSGMNNILQPLRSPITHQIIPNFPRTRRELDTLSEDRVDEILRLMEQPCQGSLVDKRADLKILCGIVGKLAFHVKFHTPPSL
ncbi:hypothetical protein F4680DRAFT_451538 [Xylaria scruposa]|nr:hypothetical protein F4680DRAFT_451538 [Xylaria scruposa]